MGIVEAAMIEMFGNMARTRLDETCWFWSGIANGIWLGHLTTNPDLRLSIRGIDAPRHLGAELIDQDGQHVHGRTIAV